jgi:hypothetical protein
MTAFAARSVPCGKGGRFIKEEQLRIPVRLHDGPADILEFQDTREPAPDLGGPYDSLLVVVQYASVAEQRATLRGGNDIAEWRNAILQRN